MRRLDAALAARWAKVALSNVTTAYPYKLDQLLNGDGDLAPPRNLHPVFWGSYDWHSCVHMHWTLARLARRFPQHDLAVQTQRHFDARFERAGVASEVAALRRPGQASFERPYGWGWLLALSAELERLAEEQPAFDAAATVLGPLASAVAERFIEYLPRAEYPVRAGMHVNSAFALLLALNWTERVQHRALAKLIAERVHRWFGADRAYPADYEPSGEDFLSPGLVEAALMHRTFDECDFADWWTQFAPPPAALAVWLTPVSVSDPSDPKIVHLHGVNLVRAWCWQRLLPSLDGELVPLVRHAIEAHLAASLPAAVGGDYVGTHWLASFALLAIDQTDER